MPVVEFSHFGRHRHILLNVELLNVSLVDWGCPEGGVDGGKGAVDTFALAVRAQSFERQARSGLHDHRQGHLAYLVEVHGVPVASQQTFTLVTLVQASEPVCGTVRTCQNQAAVILDEAYIRKALVYHIPQGLLPQVFFSRCAVKAQTQVA